MFWRRILLLIGIWNDNDCSDCCHHNVYPWKKLLHHQSSRRINNSPSYLQYLCKFLQFIFFGYLATKSIYIYYSHQYAVKKKMCSKEKPDHWLDHAREKYPDNLLEDTKSLLKLLVLFIPFFPIESALADQAVSFLRYIVSLYALQQMF